MSNKRAASRPSFFATPEDEAKYQAHAHQLAAKARERLAHVPGVLDRLVRDVAAGAPADRLAEINALIESAGPPSSSAPPAAPPAGADRDQAEARQGEGEKCKRRRGRKPDTDAKKDQRVADAWQSGAYKTHAELAIALHMKLRDVKLALDRVRWRCRSIVGRRPVKPT